MKKVYFLNYFPLESNYRCSRKSKNIYNGWRYLINGEPNPAMNSGPRSSFIYRKTHVHWFNEHLTKLWTLEDDSAINCFSTRFLPDRNPSVTTRRALKCSSNKLVVSLSAESLVLSFIVTVGQQEPSHVFCNQIHIWHNRSVLPSTAFPLNGDSITAWEEKWRHREKLIDPFQKWLPIILFYEIKLALLNSFESKNLCTQKRD